MLQDSSILVLEISRQGNQLKMGIFEQGDFVSTVRHYSYCVITVNEVDKLCQEITLLLNKAGKNGVLDNGLLNVFRKIGHLLWNQLLARPVKDKLKNTSSLNLVLSLDEELVKFPWELIYDGKEFLGLKFNLGRLINTKRHTNLPEYRAINNKLKMLIIANPTGDLKSGYQEGLFIKNQFDKRRDKVSIDFKANNADVLYLKKNLRDYDMIHFAGHCEYDPDNFKNTGWVFNDGKFTTKDILAMGDSLSLPTLVFSNACQSAKENFDLICQDYQEKVYSFASAFLFSGVRHYIGSARKIEDNVSLTFAKEFYGNLLEGRSVGESVRMGRLKLLKEYGNDSICWTSYLLYGDPSFVIFRPRIKKAALKSNKHLSVNKKQLKNYILAAAAVFLSAYLFVWLSAINPNARILLFKAQQAFDKGKNTEAILYGNRVIKKNPGFLAAYPLLADTYQRQGAMDKALGSYFDYLLASQKIDSKKDMASAYIGIGWIYYKKGDYPKAIDFYAKALTVAENNKDKLNEAISLRKLAIWYMDKDTDDKAFELLMKSAQINQERQSNLEHRYNLACDYFDIGLLFSNKDDFKAAKEFYDKSSKLFRGMRLRHELSDYYFNLGEIYRIEKEYKKTLECYAEGVKIDLYLDNKANLGADYNMIGELYLEMGDGLKAEEYFNQAILVAREIDAPGDLASIYYNLGIMYKNTGQKKKAKDYLRQSQEIYSRIDTPDYLKVKQEILSFDRE